MFKRLKDKLRTWLLDDPVDFSIVVKSPEGSTTLEAVRAVGTFLVCQSGESSRLVSRLEAVDVSRFDRLWRRFQGKNAPKWEDGTPAELS